MLAHDVMILSFDGHTPIAPASFRPGHGPLPMGPAEAVKRRIDEAIAGVDWTGPRLGVVTVGETAEVLMEIDLGAVDPVEGFVVHVRSPRGAGDLLCHLCLVHNWEALDCARGVYLDRDEPDAFDAALAIPLARA